MALTTLLAAALALTAGQFETEETSRWVSIVITAFINDAHIPVRFRIFIRNNSITCAADAHG
jgi:hypothetical protein